MTWFNTNEHILNGYISPEQTCNIIRRGIFLDVAPLYILICGHYDKENNTKLIEKFNAKSSGECKDKKYKLYDHKILLAFLNSLDLKRVKLLVTPHIFTEFIKHLWENVDNPKQFRDILIKSFKPKKYISDISQGLCYNSIIDNQDFLDKKLEIGDISILISALEKKDEKGAITILTDDETFANISDKKHDFITLYYPEIRSSTFQFKIENIPKNFLKEPES